MGRRQIAGAARLTFMRLFRQHPADLTTLFMTELWERFSYYGLQAILILYLVLPVSEGGAGLTVAEAAAIYANYTMSVYLLSLVGGYLADRWLGLVTAVFIGGFAILTGHVVLAFGSAGALYAGLTCVALGTSLLKPNITALVGRLYGAGDARRDAGFSIYYMGINLGGFIAPLACGYLAQGEAFRAWLAGVGVDAKHSWHFAFGLAAIGMAIGLVIFRSAARRLSALEKMSAQPATRSDESEPASELSPAFRLAAIAFFCASAVIFFAVAKQAGSSLNLFADRFTRNEIFGWRFPSSWFQSVYPLFVVLLAPVLSALWLRLGTRQPSGFCKAAVGLAAASVAFLIMMFAAEAASSDLASPFWLLGVYLALTIGELLVSPVGLSNVTRLAPAKWVGLVMGLWFLAIAMGAKSAGMLTGAFGAAVPTELSRGFGLQALMVAAAFLGLLALVPALGRWRARQAQRQWGAPANP